MTTSRDAAKALVNAFTTNPRPDTLYPTGIYVSSWAEMSVLSDWLKHVAHERLSDAVINALWDDVELADQEWAIAELLKHCEASIREDLHHRLGWPVLKDEEDD
jgi:hypothetical protein